MFSSPTQSRPHPANRAVRALAHATLCLSVLAGCGEAPSPASSEPDIDIDTQTSAFSEANCVTASFNDTNLKGPNGTAQTGVIFETPETYSNSRCYRTRVYGIDDPSTESISSVSAGYGGSWNLDEASCAQTVAGMQVYVLQSRVVGGVRLPATWHLISTQTQTGFYDWVDDRHGGFNYRCRRPQVQFTLQHAGAPRKYMVQVTARKPDNTTTKVYTTLGCGNVGQIACAGDTPCPWGGFADSNARCVATKPRPTPAPTPPPSMTPPMSETPPPMSMTPVCSNSVYMTVQNCLNVDGTPSQIITPGSISIWGCSNSTTNAKNNAAGGLALHGFCVSDSPRAGCCTYSMQSFAGCYCR